MNVISIKRKLVTREKAIEVARILYAHKHVRDVLLFGSLTRDDSGNDIDMIIITDHERSYDFITLVGISLPQVYRKEEKGDVGSDADERVCTQKRFRCNLAADILEDDFGELLKRAEDKAGAELDILVFPPNWRKYPKALQKALHAEPEFIANILRDAISIINIPPKS